MRKPLAILEIFRIDGRTDGPNDMARCRVSRPRLKNGICRKDDVQCEGVLSRLLNDMHRWENLTDQIRQNFD